MEGNGTETYVDDLEGNGTVTHDDDGLGGNETAKLDDDLEGGNETASHDDGVVRAIWSRHVLDDVPGSKENESRDVLVLPTRAGSDCCAVPVQIDAREEGNEN